MTVSKLTLNTKTKEISYVINFFIDDLQPVLQKHYPTQNWDFSHLNQIEIQNLTAYINEYITISVNDQDLVLNKIKLSIEEENVCQVYFEDELTLDSKITKLAFFNILMLKDYTTQSNIVHIFIDNSNKKSFNLEKGNAYFELAL